MLSFNFGKKESISKIENQKISEPYDKSVVIEGLTYNISLWPFEPFDNSEKLGLKIYSLDFGTEEHGSAITNKGMETFRKLTTEMRTFFDEVNEKEHIDAITFKGATTRLNSDEHALAKEIGKQVEEKLRLDSHLLDGFSHEQDGKKIIVENGYLILEGEFDKPGHFSIKAISEKSAELPELPEWFKPEIWKFMYRNSHPSEIIEKMTDQSDKGAAQRLALYERTLKRSFPEYEFERAGEDSMRVVVYINKEKKNRIKEEFSKISKY
jgi:hypothetical protein